jgi:hypothetical protein
LPPPRSAAAAAAAAAEAGGSPALGLAARRARTAGMRPAFCGLLGGGHPPAPPAPPIAADPGGERTGQDPPQSGRLSPSLPPRPWVYFCTNPCQFDRGGPGSSRVACMLLVSGLASGRAAGQDPIPRRAGPGQPWPPQARAPAEIAPNRGRRACLAHMQIVRVEWPQFAPTRGARRRRNRGLPTLRGTGGGAHFTVPHPVLSPRYSCDRAFKRLHSTSCHPFNTRVQRPLKRPANRPSRRHPLRSPCPA